MADKESSADLVDQMDFDDQPVRRKWKNPFISVAPFFFVTDLFDRFSYYAATGSMTVYFQRLGLSSVLATQMQSTFQSIVYVAPLIGAYCADSFFGRYKTIVVSFILYTVGMFMVAGSAVPGFNNSILYFIGLFAFLAPGSGMIKPNLIVMGGDQFDETDPREAKMKSSYFSYFYWCTNVAAFLAFSIMAGLAVQGMGAVPKELGFVTSYGIAAICAALGLVSFVAGTPRYYKAKPSGSVLPTFFKLIGGSATSSLHGMAIIIGAVCEVVGVLATIVSFFYENAILTYCATGLVVLGVVLFIVFGQDPSWVGRNNTAVDEQTIFDAQQVIRMMPYVGFIVIFWSVYNQMNTNFVTQGCQMYDVAFGIKWSPSQLSTFNTIGVLAGVPIADRVLYPLMGKMGFPATPLRRVGLGFFVCAITMAESGFIEIWRKATPVTTEMSSCTEIPMNELNLMWQVPQYVLVGVAEVFTAITYYDLFYSEVPSSMRSVCQAINMLTTSLGTMLGGTINSLCRAFLPNNLNEGNMEYVYFLIAILSAANLLVYIFVSRGFKYQSAVEEASAADLVEADDDAFGKTSRRASTVSAR